MDQVEFEREAGRVLDSLFEQIEEQLGDWLEVDLEAGILKLELPDGGTYIINKHAPNRAIMLPDESFGSYFLDVFGRPQRISACECERVSEANLANMGGE